MASEVLKQFRRFNRDLLKDPNVYLFIGELFQRRFIVTNLDMNNVTLPTNYLYRDGTVIIKGIPYEVVSREKYRNLH